MEVSVLTDEIDRDIFTAMDRAVAWGIRRFEIRRIGRERVPSVAGPVWERVREAVRFHGAFVTTLSPGLFKKAESLIEDRVLDGRCWWEDPDAYECYRARAYEVLDTTIDMARSVDSSAVTIFTPEVPRDRAGQECPGRIVELIRDAATRAARQGVTLLLENDFGLWADTGQRSMRVLRSVGQANVRLNWDPANALVAGEVPFPGGYRHVRGVVGNVHAKDATTSTPPISEEYEVLGMGAIDWWGQIRALHDDGYTGSICIETHSHPLTEKSHANARFLRDMIDRLPGLTPPGADARGLRNEKS